MTPLVEQPALPLVYRPRLSEQDFVTSDTNRDAVAWLARPDLWPMPRCVLIGPAASGKSHLAAMFAARQPALVFDDADLLTDGEPLFHAWNAADRARPLLMTATRMPRFWAHRLPDLASRLAATPQVRLEDPDDVLIAAVLVKCFADRGLRVGDDVVAWLVTRIERSFAAATDVVARLDQAALSERRDITVPMARALLEEQGELGL
ncbi:HdaA/DnaA family protein [Polymorphobacter fuscus]|uniref:Chromosomal replication initiator DnaA n=1 Tax=Sandarakinorhabdus fusca TaxID=1439888 RepID=A0A7C9GMY0_9SPHN|nr:chromosomal replication initiator DnaA [Polymorphobacter fuscus]KAB7648712.1 chromosomal replication initiator DnaA [Polymorphobacter fuscus]MQT16275.1 chromosomal replication initiator DnaA [Polymorphobacter fuscus]NJC07440.1 chromosomal replication initiation ATPase DnaA [Polymorphobacter fuscus]